MLFPPWRSPLQDVMLQIAQPYLQFMSLCRIGLAVRVYHLGMKVSV